MRYNEKEEIEATGEWLMRIGKVGFSEELTYIPSDLSRMGVAPRDVVDRLDYLRSRCGLDGGDHGRVEAAVLDKPEVVVVEELVKELPVLEVETLEGRPIIPVAESSLSLVFDYDSHGPWLWMEPNERLLEEALSAVLDPEPGLHEFNELAAEVRIMSQAKARGRRARVAVASRVTSLKTPELVGSNSVGASA